MVKLTFLPSKFNLNATSYRKSSLTYRDLVGEPFVLTLCLFLGQKPTILCLSLKMGISSTF